MTDTHSAPPSRVTGRRNANLVAAGILLSRLSGLAREVALVNVLGSGAVVDVFRVAFRIPNLMQNLLGEGVLSASFIPVYRRMLDEGDDEAAGRLAGAIGGLLIALTGVLVVVGVLFARPITALIAFGFTGEKFEIAVQLVRILTPGIGFLVLSAWCLGILNSHRRFFLPYVAPVLLNAVATGALVFAAIAALTQVPATRALAWGMTVGGALQFVVQLPSVRRVEPNLRLSLDRSVRGVGDVLRAFGPVVGARGVVQVSSLVNLSFATLLATGGFAAIGFVQVLYVLPISLFGMSIAAAELPDLASMGSADRAVVGARIRSSLERVGFFVLPVTLSYLVAGGRIVDAMTTNTAFPEDVVEQVGLVLLVYSLSLLPTTASRVVQSLRYGLGDTRSPARASIARVAVSTVVAVAVMFPLDRLSTSGDGLTVIGTLSTFGPVATDLRGAGPSALRLGAMAFGIGAFVGSWIEYVHLRRATREDVGVVSIGGGRLWTLAWTAGVGLGVGIVAAPGSGLVGLVLDLLVGGTIYVLLARARGIDEADVLWRTALRLVGRSSDDDASDEDDDDDDGPRWSLQEARRLQAMERARRCRSTTTERNNDGR